MQQDMEEKVFGVETKIELGYSKKVLKRYNERIFKHFNHVYRININDAEEEDKLKMVNEMVEEEKKRGLNAEVFISQGPVRQGVLCEHILCYRDYEIYRGEIIMKGKDDNGKVIFEEKPRYIRAH